MKNFKPNLIKAALITSGFAFGISPALAQEAAAGADDETEIIQVTGIRGSLQKAQAIKMSSTSIVEVISAEDIGKLPDTSIAESISRLPGITSQRLNGRSNVIAIRGLGEDFSTATFNGRELVSINDNRGIEFDLFPSEIMNEVVVYKSPDASLVTQGIAGTVDLRTVSPLSHGERALVVNARYEENSLGKLNPDVDDTGYRGSISYIDQFADDTLGVALSVTSMSSPSAEERWDAWGYSDRDGVRGIDGAKPFVRSSELSRDAIMGVIEFAPSDSLKTTLDVLYVDFKDDQRLRGVELPIFSGAGWTNEGIENVTVEDGFVTSGNIINPGALLRNDATVRDADMIAIGQNTQFTIGDSWELEADISYSKVNRKDFAFESYAGFSTDENPGRGNTNGPRGDIAFALQPGNEGITYSPELDFSDYNNIQLANPFDWGWDGRALLPGAGGSQPAQWNQDGFINELEIEDELKSIRFQAKRIMDEGFISAVEFGVNYSAREKTKFNQGNYLTVRDAAYESGAVDFVSPQDIPEQYRLSDVSLDFIGLGNMLAYDSFAFLNDGGYVRTDANFVDTGRPKGSWTVNENIWAAYVKADVDTEIGGIAVTGNFGVQVQSIDQRSDGFAAGIKGGEETNYTFNWTPTSGGTDYTEVLPSVNLAFEVAENQIVRFGAARTLTRSRMDRINASFGASFDASKATSTNINNSPWGGDGGNPELAAITADGVDLSYDWYYSPEGYVSIAGFYRKLNDWQAQEQVLTDFSGVEVPSIELPDGTAFNILTQGFVSGWVNVDGGDISGLELSGVLPFNAIDDSLEGFGLQFSYTLIDSEVLLPGAIEPESIPGQSDKLYSLSFYYENYGFQARASLRNRDDFLSEVSGISLSREQRTAFGEDIIDVQIGYDFAESGIEGLEGLTAQIQVQNVTNEPFTTFNNGDQRQVKDFQVYGRTLLAGVIYKF